MKSRISKLKSYLDNNYLEYRQLYSSADPVWELHNFKKDTDIEIAGFLISCLSYGRVEIINKFVSELFKNINNEILEFTINFTKGDSRYFKNFYYRFNTIDDLIYLFLSLKKTLLEFGSLKKLFLRKYDRNDINILPALNNFTNHLRNSVQASKGFYYLIPDSSGNSACKRLNLFLRWMVRKDEIDFGIWGREVDKSKLIIPVDIHVYRISRLLGLIKRSSCDMKFALELTEKLKEFDKEDPVKYDFALCHIGIENKKPPSF